MIIVWQNGPKICFLFMLKVNISALLPQALSVFSLLVTALSSRLPPLFHSRLLHRQLRRWNLPAGQSPGQHARQHRLLCQEHQAGRVRPAGDRNRRARYRRARVEQDWALRSSLLRPLFCFFWRINPFIWCFLFEGVSDTQCRIW